MEGGGDDKGFSYSYYRISERTTFTLPHLQEDSQSHKASTIVFQ